MQNLAERPNRAERRHLWVMGYVAGSVTVLFNGMPVVVGALARDRHMVASQLGDFSAAGYLGQLLAVGSAFFWIQRAKWRSTLRCCVLSAIATYVIMAYARAPWLLIASSCVAGASMGACVALTLSYWGSASNAPRAISIGTLGMVLMASTFLYAAPVFFTPHFGMRGAPLLLSVILLPLFPLSCWMPEKAAASSAASKPSANSAAALAGLILMAIYFFGIFAVWAFLDRIGTARGLSPSEIGIALSVSMLVGAVALLLTTIVGERWGLLLPLTISFVLWGAFFAVLLRPQSTALFTGALILFNSAWNLSLPYQTAIVARSDATGRLIVLLPAFQAAGATGGPYLAGQFVASGQFGFTYSLLAVGVVISLVGYGVLAGQQRRRSAEQNRDQLAAMRGQ
jgi:hypothetical protein